MFHMFKSMEGNSYDLGDVESLYVYTSEIAVYEPQTN